MATPPSVAAAVFLVACALGSCNLENEGEFPPGDDLYFPNALSIHPGGGKPRYLFVANSNFDLKYSRGSVQAVSLEKLQETIDDCDEDPCQITNLEDLVTAEVLISSHATALAMSSDGRFLFATSRTDDNLAYISVDLEADDEGVLDCGQGRLCDRQRAEGVDPETGKPAIWPPDPMAVVAGPLTDWEQDETTLQAWRDEGWFDDPDVTPQYALVAHRFGQVSLVVEQPDGSMLMSSSLAVTGGDVTGLAYDPTSRYIYLTRVGGAGLRSLVRVGIAISPTGAGSFPFAAGSVGLQGIAATPDTRAISFLPPALAETATLREDRAVVLAGLPNSLLLADVNEARNPPATATVKRIVEVGAGPSRVAVGRVAAGEGDDGAGCEAAQGAPPCRLLAVVSCITSRQIYVIDLESMQPLAVVPNLSGPFDLALDAARGLLYVTDFRSSVIRVLDVKPAVAGSEDPVRLVATIGEPKVVQELR